MDLAYVCIKCRSIRKIGTSFCVSKNGKLSNLYKEMFERCKDNISYVPSCRRCNSGELNPTNQ